MPSVKSVGGDVGGQAEQLVDRDAQRPCRRGRGARCRARTWRRRGRGWRAVHRALDAAMPARRRRARPSPTASSEQRHDRGHRLRRLAVEPVRVALPHPDDAREPVVAELDDDRGDRLAVARGRSRAIRNGSRRAERGATSWRQPRGVTPAARPTAARRRRSRIAGHSRSAPKRNGIVGRQAGLGGDRVDDPARLVVVRGRATC